MTHDPYSVTPRKSLTAKQRHKMFIDRSGKCCVCGGKVDGVKDRWIDEHLVPLADGGTNDLDNRGIAHETCARSKTSKEATDRAKHRSAAQRHFGAKRATMPGSRNSPWKKKMNGQVVPR